MTLYNLAEGERLKLSAHATLAARREVFVLRGRRALLAALLEHDTATADDVRAVGVLPAGVNPKCFGSVPGLLARAGLIRRVGFTETARAVAHARPVGVWELANRAAAIAWLATHPEPCEPEPSEGDAGPTLFDLNESKTPDAGTPGAC